MGDVSSIIDPRWMSCPAVVELARQVKSAADYTCTSSSPCTHWASSTISTITYVEGDVALPTGKGLILITGTATQNGHDSWDGLLLCIGKGGYQFSGGGSGHAFGGALVANVAGPDRLLFTADDCTSGVGGFEPASYVGNGGGNKDTIYCRDAIQLSLKKVPFRMLTFRQR